jgi:transposase
LSDSLFFDNNQAERDLRMMKVREKICLRRSTLRFEGGTFRSEEHATVFCDLRAVLSSAAKQGRDLLGTLTKLLAAPQELGEDLAKG